MELNACNIIADIEHKFLQIFALRFSNSRITSLVWIRKAPKASRSRGNAINQVLSGGHSMVPFSRPVNYSAFYQSRPSPT